MINPGGYLDVEDIIGREAEIARYWRILDRQGLVLSAERRIGKTHILRKMQARGREGFTIFYQELERVHSMTELVSQLYQTVGRYLPTLKKIKEKAVELWTKLSIDRLGELKLPTAADSWKSLLTMAINDVIEVAKPENDKILLMWDELPLMLYNLLKREGADKTIQLLDLLRHLRQVHGHHLRMLFTGSIGLHLVLRSLRIAGNANDPTNDMLSETVPPMSWDDSLSLSMKLVNSLAQPPAEPAALATALAREVGGFPYHLHHTADWMDQLGRPAVVSDVSAGIDALVLADNDPAHLGYNVERIKTYYDAEIIPVAFTILDALAAADKPLGLVEITNLVHHKMPEIDENVVQDTCGLVRHDHYLTLTKAGYEFRWPLVKRWWRENRL
jgi:hypothetical protein